MMKSTTGRFKIGARQSMFCATAGLALYLLTTIIVGSGGSDAINAITVIGSIFAEVPLETTFCLVVFYSWAQSARSFAGARIRRSLEDDDSPNYLIGIAPAYSSAAFGFLAVFSAAVLRQVATAGIEAVAAVATIESFEALLYMLLTVILLGSIPAAVLGIVYTFLVARAVRRELRIEI